MENLRAAYIQLRTNYARAWFLRSLCTWHDEGCGVTGVRRSPSNGTYLPEQLPWLRSVEAGNTMHRQHAFDSMQIPAPRPDYYLHLNSRVSAPKASKYFRTCLRIFVCWCGIKRSNLLCDMDSLLKCISEFLVVVKLRIYYYTELFFF